MDECSRWPPCWEAWRSRFAVLFRQTDKNGHEAVMFIKEERVPSIMAQPI